MATVPATVPRVMPSHMQMPYRPTTRPRRFAGHRLTSQAAPAVYTVPSPAPCSSRIASSTPRLFAV